MNVLFWNIARKNLAETIAQIAQEHDIDLIVLTECDALDEKSLLSTLFTRTSYKYSRHHGPVDGRIVIYTRFISSTIVSLSDDPGIVIKRITPPGSPSLIMAAIHSPSQLYWNSPSDRLALAISIRTYLEKAEELEGHKRSFIVGDFNSDPFDDALTNSEGLHAVMHAQIASKRSRLVNKQQRHFLYNPMWSLFGDGSSGPPGSYYYSKSTSSCRFWHMFDQLLLRPSLLPAFKKSSLALITCLSNVSFTNNAGLPNKSLYSDHFPLTFTLETLGRTLDD